MMMMTLMMLSHQVKGHFIAARHHSPSSRESGGQALTESGSNDASYVVNKDTCSYMDTGIALWMSSVHLFMWQCQV